MGGPPGHGTYQGLDLELLDPDDEDERTFLLQAQHPELEEALQRGVEVTVRGEPMNPRLHVTLHVMVANQLLADDPPQTWQTVQRLAGLGYDWHNIMHMISGLVAEDVHRAMTEKQRAGRAARRNGDLVAAFSPSALCHQRQRYAPHGWRHAPSRASRPWWAGARLDGGPARSAE